MARSAAWSRSTTFAIDRRASWPKTIRRLATLEPQMLALMHGSSTRTRCSESLLRLADTYDLLVQQG
jgi:hypothetical protein